MYEQIVMRKLDWYIDYLKDEKLDPQEREAAKSLVVQGVLLEEVNDFNGEIYYRKAKNDS